MSEYDHQPNRKRLWLLAVVSALIGALVSIVFWNQIESGGGMGWIGWVMIGTLGVIAYSICFYFCVIWFENTLEQFIVSDKFGRKHRWIDVQTETRTSGDDKVDGWVAHYKFTRTMFAMGLLPLLACIYLFFFA